MFTDFFKVLGKKKRKAADTKGYVQLGDDGLYFQNLDDAYLNSPTATMALLKFHEYCVPSNLKQEFQKLWKKIESDYIKYGYYLIHVSYTVDGGIDKYKYLNPKYYLVKDKDDNDNASSFINTKTKTVYPAFNNNLTVVKSQFDKAGDKGYLDYKGQIYMYNDGSLPYRITPLYSVLKWMRTEADASTYIDKACDNAMFGNNIFIAKKSSNATTREIEVMTEVKEAISSVKGVEEAAQNLLIEYEGDIEDVTKLISKISISNEVNVDLLNAADDKASDKICLACYGLPPILVKQSESVFGNSGEAISVATDEWQKSCLREATNILDGLKEIGLIITDAEPVTEVQPIEEIDDATKQAQATLKGSVGGVQALLQVQASYAAKTTTFESAIAILELIFGFTREQAIKLLGSPEIITDNGSTNNPDTPGA